jgi:hypothetical protein
MSTESGRAAMKGPLESDERADNECAAHSADDHQFIVTHAMCLLLPYLNVRITAFFAKRTSPSILNPAFRESQPSEGIRMSWYMPIAR